MIKLLCFKLVLKYFPHFTSPYLINKILRLVQGDFLMIGASTGVGKSGLLLNFMNEVQKASSVFFLLYPSLHYMFL